MGSDEADTLNIVKTQIFVKSDAANLDLAKALVAKIEEDIEIDAAEVFAL